MELRLRERPDLISRQMAAKILDKTPSTISNYLLSGHLAGEQISGHVFVSKSDVEAMKAGRRPSRVDAKTQQRYSLARAAAQAAGLEPRKGLEHEMSVEYLRVMSSAANGRPVIGEYAIPTWAVWSPPPFLAAGLDSGTATKGAELKITRPGQFGTPLRPRSVALELGATFLEMGFPFSIPKQATSPDAEWVPENPGSDWGAVTDETFALVPFTGHTLTAGTSVSRSLMRQSHTSTAVDEIIARDFRGRFGAALDRASIYNGADANAPTGGIISNASVPVIAIGVNGGVPTYDHMTALEESVALADGDFGNLGVASTPSIRRLLRKTQRAASAGNGFVWDKGGTVLDYPAAASRVCPSTLSKGTSVGVCHSIIFGAWDSLVIAGAEAMTLVVDEFAKKKQGMVELQAYLLADIGVVKPAQFAVITDATLV